LTKLLAGPIVLMVLGLPALPAWSGEGRGEPLPHQAVSTASLLDFDIPAQPLNSALDQYGSVARQPALYRSEMVRGQRSATLRGRYTPEDALRVLLAGTGLVAERFASGDRNGFVLARPSAAAPSAVMGELTQLDGDPERIQAQVWQALCAEPATRPGRYRSLLRFEVDSVGQIQRPRLVSTTGDSQRDAALLATLGRLRFAQGSAPVTPRSVTMLLLPHTDGFERRCDLGGSGAVGSAVQVGMVH